MTFLRPLLSRGLPRSLHHRLQGAVALVLVTTLVLLGAHTVQEQSRQARSAMQGQAADRARLLAHSIGAMPGEGRSEAIAALVEQALVPPQVLSVEVSDAAARVHRRWLRGSGPAGEATLPLSAPSALRAPPAASGVAFDEAGQRISAWQALGGDPRHGWVRVEEDAGALAVQRRQAWTATALAVLMGGLASVGLLHLLLRRPMRAIDEARRFAVGLRRIDGQQIERLDGPDETVELARALNQASSKLYELRRRVGLQVDDLQRQESVLAETLQQLHTLFALSPDALLSFNAEGRVRFANAAFYRLTGLLPGQVLDHDVDALDALLRPRCTEPEAFAGLEACFAATQLAGGATPRCRLTLALPRPTVLELVGVCSEVTSASRLLYLRDITHESEVDRLKSEFLSTAAHELRTPMTGIHAVLELLTTRDYGPQRQRHLLDIAHRQSLAMIAIVNELLDLARIEARGAADLELQSTELAAVATAALRDFVPPPGRAVPRWTCNGPPVPVQVDPAKLAQVVHNLLSNAYKYSQPVCAQAGRDEVLVQLLPPRPAGEGQEAGIAVHDRGVGMTPEQLARVCERFYRADSSGQVPGTGLGMSIVQQIVGLMNGRLAFDSTPDHGTSVTVWLPVEVRQPCREQDAATA